MSFNLLNFKDSDCKLISFLTFLNSHFVHLYDKISRVPIGKFIIRLQIKKQIYLKNITKVLRPRRQIHFKRKISNPAIFLFYLFLQINSGQTPLFFSHITCLKFKWSKTNSQIANLTEMIKNYLFAILDEFSDHRKRSP